MKMFPSQIKQKIKEVEHQLEITEVNMVSVEYYKELLIIYHELWELLYFKLHLEKTYLDAPKKEDNSH